MWVVVQVIFREFYMNRVFSVTGLDLRRENIEVCQERYPDIKFGLIDLDENFGEIGTYDLVLMFGILYPPSIATTDDLPPSLGPATS